MSEPGLLVAPVWVLVGLVGALGTAVSGVVAPPSLRQLPRSLAGAVVGAGLGHLIGEGFAAPDPLVGDLHLGTAALGALLAVVIVRRLIP